ncbi:CidA/LrgA family protein [Pseudothioclava nitratireducens]|jgi:putative effector of murein hydrolase LrgA (UPF0299 family)|uniref:CidA/LrgA family protein n=1 Tax=Pseudothioclava nitratireducens TaxID=1928646 RepID=UPI0023DADD34|nr:CidA/LrgA family protein [Defluviimonas nitratireducens]MDF1619788.1 CidA/LrgA family protein [Defluviimonas nitratireducens]
MIPALVLILFCQLVGEVISRGAHLPLPGPVLGMILLLVGLSLSERLQAIVRPTAQGILGHLSLLFVPAGVGVVAHLPVLQSHGLALAAALVVSTIAAILVGAASFALVNKMMGGQADE